ncbi:MAG: hypothetical protein ACI8Y7_000874 [Candidatus Woesearchaeota archaeon]|jgi:hypothetical protein
MHLGFNSPLKTDAFSYKYQLVTQLFDQHPLLSQKSNTIGSLHIGDVQALHMDVHMLMGMLDQEKELWSTITLSKNHLTHANVAEKPLDPHEKQFVKTNHMAVRSIFGPAFVDLEEYAVVSDECAYKGAYGDYELFRQAADSITQLNSMDDVLARQNFLLNRMSFRLKHNADAANSDITQLRDSLLDQKALLSRLPHLQFS